MRSTVQLTASLEGQASELRYTVRTKGNWTGKTHRTGNYIKCVQCAELLNPDTKRQVYFELIAQLVSMLLRANRSHLQPL